MDRMDAFERQVAGVVGQATRPPRGVDAMAIVRSVRETTPKSGFAPLFGATRFVVAGVIVALFGGFVLASVGRLRPDVATPLAAATSTSVPVASATPQSIKESATPKRVVRSDLLPRVDLVTEEVEPGVLRVVSDGVRDLAWAEDEDGWFGYPRRIVPGVEGSMWLFGPQEMYRLGDPASQGPPADQSVFRDPVVGQDGTAWVPTLDGEKWRSFEGRSWTGLDDDIEAIEVARDGTVWAAWTRGAQGRCHEHLRDRLACAAVIGAIGPGDLEATPRVAPSSLSQLRDRPDDHYSRHVIRGLWATDAGDVWLLEQWGGAGSVLRRPVLIRFDGQDFQSVDVPDGVLQGAFAVATFAMGPDGTFWSRSKTGLARYDGTEWATFDDVAGGAYDVRAEGDPGFIKVGPDGSVWMPTRGCAGLAKFDGGTWSRFLHGHCIDWVDIGLDGSAWVIAVRRGADPTRPPTVETFVIAPGASGHPDRSSPPG